MSSEDWVSNGLPRLSENTSDVDNPEKQKNVVINDETEIINGDRRRSYDNSERIKKLSRQNKCDVGLEREAIVDFGNIIPELTINRPHVESGRKMEILPTETVDDSASLGENAGVSVKPNASNKIQHNINNSFRSKTRGVETVNSETSAKPTVADERLTERRKSFVPMSSMEEENLRERLHLAQLKKCNEIISKDLRYTRENFRKLFQTEVGLILCITIVIIGTIYSVN